MELNVSRETGCGSATTSFFRHSPLRDRSRAMIARANSFDVIVIGGGHAGCEAAAAAARMGAQDRADDPSVRDHRRDVLQSGDRRSGQGSSGPRNRRAGRPDGPGGGRGRHPVPGAQPAQRPGGARAARPGRPQALRRGHAGARSARPPISGGRRRGRRSDRLETAE